MSDTIILLIVILGGAAGLAIVGVAFWIMRQESTAAPKAGADGTPAAAALQPAGDTGQSPAAVAPPDGAAPPAGESAVASEAVTQAGLLQTDSAGSDPGIPPSPAGQGAEWMARLREQATPPEPAPAQPPGPAEPPIPAPAKAPSPAGWLGSLTARVAAGSTPIAPAQELLKLLRTPEGELIVEVYGRRYRSRVEITDAPIEQQIANASSDLKVFLNAPLPEPIKATPPAALPPIGSPAGSRKEPHDTRPVVKVSLQEAAQMEVKPPSMDIMRQLRYVRDQQRKPVVQIKSVMDEIDEILQVMLIGSPLAGRGLKATDGSHGAVFSLDNRNYDSVDTLPDAEAREMLRAAIQKWDQK